MGPESTLTTAAGLDTLPRLLPAAPPPGQKRQAPALHGSADAFGIAQLGLDGRATGTAVVVICAQALIAQRLKDEIAWLAPSLRVALFPDWETLPYDHFSPHQDLVSERLATLYQCSRGECDVLLAAATTALGCLPPPSYLAGHTFFIKRGERLDLDRMRAQMTLAGYQHVTQVVSPGEYTVRGGLIDLFPMGSAVPYRIDLLDEDVESIKTFDADTQRTIYPVPEIRLLPAREFPTDENSRTGFRRRFREAFEGDPSRSQLYKDVSSGILPGGIEYYLPLFFDETATLLDYLPANSIVVARGDVATAIERFWQDTEARWKLLRGDRTRPLLPPNALYLPVDALFGALKAFPRIDLPDPMPESTAGPTLAPPSVQVDRRADDPLSALKRHLDAGTTRTLVCAESPGRRETMLQYFVENGLRLPGRDPLEALLAGGESAVLSANPLHHGFAWPDARLTILTEEELYAGVVRRTGRRDRMRATTVDAMLRDLAEVKIGDPVVHEQHGIGRYLGLVTLDLGDGSTEFLQLQYANDAKLYVPVGSLHLISRYSGANPEDAPLHALGSDKWDKAKRKAAQAARDTAAELLHLYAHRAARQGHAFRLSPHDYDAFCAGFEFEETPDQATAIEAVIKDLTAGRPMDRLVCGDVGFGKTEVALRAAFVALAEGMQVAVLVPTTLLAEQHFLTFSDRFADFPVKIAELSRFRTQKEAKAALGGLADGSIDLVIGTHRLIQSDVKFSKLGLVIIDEEHRFGVRQKEQLKRLRAEVDVLTLTATPIPRTLAMSMEGLRDFSVITTAPQKRLAIKTFVTPYSSGIVREAALRELKRGGQVYFVHNDIDTIETMRTRLADLLPEARIAVGHGQMPERELEHVMRDFYQQRCNVLLCSTIIETGIDVPTANTIVINRADKFGLAQLHQLRGRVGRSHHQAYAYLLTPPSEALSQQAKKRLEAIQAMEELGSGFFLAMHDLEIRGAGEVLGESQSGEMQAVGFQLYSDMLDAAVRALKTGREPDLDQPLGVTTEINLHLPALLPSGYCSDVHERLVLYKRLANCETIEALDAMYEELVDRFGVAPGPAQALLACHRLRIRGKPLGVIKVDAGPDRTVIQFVEHPPFDPMRLIDMVQKDGRYRFAGPDRLRIDRAAPSLADRAQLVEGLYATLRPT